MLEAWYFPHFISPKDSDKLKASICSHKNLDPEEEEEKQNEMLMMTIIRKR
jgi:hypothetical protein